MPTCQIPSLYILIKTVTERFSNLYKTKSKEDINEGSYCY